MKSKCLSEKNIFHMLKSNPFSTHAIIGSLINCFYINFSLFLPQTGLITYIPLKSVTVKAG